MVRGASMSSRNYIFPFLFSGSFLQIVEYFYAERPQFIMLSFMTS